MDKIFAPLFSEPPLKIIDGDYYYSADDEGDPFDEADTQIWFGNAFENAWANANYGENAEFAQLYLEACRVFDRRPAPFLEIACGPGMGLSPILCSRHTHIPFIASDASSLLIKSWRTYANEHLSRYNVNLASFSAFDIPIYDNSLDYVTSFIGVSSTRAGEAGQIRALNEIYRILKDDGYFIAIENEWTDYDAIKRVFDLWGKPVWDVFLRKAQSWQAKFDACGYNIESCDTSIYKKLTKYDNDLGEAADIFGVDIGMKYTLYILRKPRKAGD